MYLCRHHAFESQCSLLQWKDFDHGHDPSEQAEAQRVLAIAPDPATHRSSSSHQEHGRHLQQLVHKRDDDQLPVATQPLDERGDVRTIGCHAQDDPCASEFHECPGRILRRGIDIDVCTQLAGKLLFSRVAGQDSRLEPELDGVLHRQMAQSA